MYFLTKLVEYLVALVEHEVLDVLEVEVPGADERQDPAGRADDDVRAVVAQCLLVLLHQHAAEEHRDLHAVHVLGEALVLLADLECQLPCVAHHQHRHLQRCQSKQPQTVVCGNTLLTSVTVKPVLFSHALYFTNFATLATSRK